MKNKIFSIVFLLMTVSIFTGSGQEMLDLSDDLFHTAGRTVYLVNRYFGELLRNNSNVGGLDLQGNTLWDYRFHLLTEIYAKNIVKFECLRFLDLRNNWRDNELSDCNILNNFLRIVLKKKTLITIILDADLPKCAKSILSKNGFCVEQDKETWRRDENSTLSLTVSDEPRENIKSGDKQVCIVM